MRNLILAAVALCTAGAVSAQTAPPQNAPPKMTTSQPTAQSRAAETTPASVQGKSLGGNASMHQLKADELTRSAMASTGMRRAQLHRQAAKELRVAADLHEKAAQAAQSAIKGQ